MSRYKRKIGFFGRLMGRRSRRYRYDRNEHSGFSVGSLVRSIFNIIINTSPETRKGIFIISLFVFGALSVLGLLDLSGSFGQLTNYILSITLGHIKWLFPVFLAGWIFTLLNEEKYGLRLINYFGIFLLFLGLSGFFHIFYDLSETFRIAKEGLGGGYLGASASWLLLTLMNIWGGLVILTALVLIGMLLAFETSIYGIMWPFKLFNWLIAKLKDFYLDYKLKKQERLLNSQEELGDNEDNYEEEEDKSIKEVETNEEDVEEENDNPSFTEKEIKMGFKDDETIVEKKIRKYGSINIPLNLFSNKVGKATAGDIKANEEVIRKTLNNFGIPVEMAGINIGPTVTQYTMRPVDGVRLSKITTLNADLALALAAHPIRIEAPIPGKSLVGIEVPNIQTAKVTMGEVLSSKEFKERSNNLNIALGKDVSGRSVFAQLDKMPHLLVAGATGSGKSVCVNSIIVSLMYQNSPDELKFILVDPKRVELPLYNGTPYLLTPVITDVKKTIGSLKWAITEMERRFELLAKFGNRNIASYNSTHSEKIPYIVIIIDELADLMATAANDMEAGIVRLAQMARAVGIHLILATQRPSTEVITGLIKANIPARIAFSVASSIDSRTILDGSGAEKLVGRGDMLYLGPDLTKPKRIQGVFLSDNETADVIKFIKSHGEAEYEEALSSSSSGSGSYSGGFGDSDEPLINEAVEIIKESGKASASLLQRRLKLGYARAARILDILEEKGIIGPADGAKPREVFLDALGVDNPLAFSAREHGLSGELRKVRAEEDEEPSFTAFTRNSDQEEDLVENEVEEIEDNNEDEEVLEEVEIEESDDNDDEVEESEELPEFLQQEITAEEESINIETTEEDDEEEGLPNFFDKEVEVEEPINDEAITDEEIEDEDIEDEMIEVTTDEEIEEDNDVEKEIIETEILPEEEEEEEEDEEEDDKVKKVKRKKIFDEDEWS
jgi:DNA segregation ATPase FtsK/SpoIIIE, S-DNA-T family